jgi:hypothetical protein
MRIMARYIIFDYKRGSFIDKNNENLITKKEKSDCLLRRVYKEGAFYT